MRVGSYVICENTWLDDKPNFFSSEPILFARCSKPKASEERKYCFRAKRSVKYRSVMRTAWRRELESQRTSPRSTHYRHTKHMLPHNLDGLLILFKIFKYFNSF